MDEARVKTYIKGFDDQLDGGIPKGSLVLLCGPPGSMKTTLAYNLLFNGAKNEGLNGTYFTFEQGRDSLAKQMASLGMDPDDVDGKVSIVDFGLIRRNLETMESKSWLDIFKMYAENMKKNTGYDILVLDSLPVLEILSKFENPREELFYFFEWLRELDVTCIIITEMSSLNDNYGEHGEDYISDGIIHTKMERMNDENIQRRIRCVKMRGAEHCTDYFTLIVEGGNFQVARVISQ